MLILFNPEGGPNKGVLFLLAAASFVGFAYYRKQAIDRERRLPGDVSPHPTPLLGIYQLPVEGGGGATQIVDMKLGERVQVNGLELASTGYLWRAVANNNALKVQPPSREQAEVGPTRVTFNIDAVKQGVGSVNFSLVNPANEVIRTWTLTAAIDA
jgi:hypothetical protein